MVESIADTSHVRCESTVGPIRLAHVCSSDLAITALMPFCTPLLERGWQITMITPDGPHARKPLPGGMRWLPFALQRRIHPPSDLIGTLQLARYLQRERFHIVHTHNIKAGHVGRVVAAAMRVPIIVHTIHGIPYSLDTPTLKRTGHAMLERVANLGCDLVFSQSREDLSTYVATRVAAPEKLVWIGNGIDLRRFAPAAHAPVREEIRCELGLSVDDVVFISAGRLIVEKGFLELFEAAALARREDARIRLLVVGDVDDRNDTLDAARLDAARAAGVLLPGRREDMPALYAASDVVVLASWHEGVPRVLMEGAAMGKALLATDVRGCREVIESQQHGILTPPRDARALARAMVTLARDARLRGRMGLVNAQRAKELYAIERSVSIVNGHYERLLATAGLP